MALQNLLEMGVPPDPHPMHPDNPLEVVRQTAHELQNHFFLPQETVFIHDHGPYGSFEFEPLDEGNHHRLLVYGSGNPLRHIYEFENEEHRSISSQQLGIYVDNIYIFVWSMVPNILIFAHGNRLGTLDITLNEHDQGFFHFLPQNHSDDPDVEILFVEVNEKDGRFITCGNDSMMVFCDAEFRRSPIPPIKVHIGDFQAKWSPSGKKIATVSQTDHTIKLVQIQNFSLSPNR